MRHESTSPGRHAESPRTRIWRNPPNRIYTRSDTSESELAGFRVKFKLQCYIYNLHIPSGAGPGLVRSRPGSPGLAKVQGPGRHGGMSRCAARACHRRAGRKTFIEYFFAAGMNAQCEVWLRRLVVASAHFFAFLSNQKLMCQPLFAGQLHGLTDFGFHSF